jgi:hypothetical protein
MGIPLPPGWELINAIMDGTTELLRQAGVFIDDRIGQFSPARTIYRTKEKRSPTKYGYSLVFDDGELELWRPRWGSEGRGMIKAATVSLADPQYIEKLVALMPTLFEFELREAFIADFRSKGFNVTDDGQILVNGSRDLEFSVLEDKASITYGIAFMASDGTTRQWHGQSVSHTRTIRVLDYEVELANPKATELLVAFIKSRRIPIAWWFLDKLALLFERYKRVK